MALTWWNMMNIGVGSSNKTMLFEVSCSSRKRDRGILPYKVVEITPPPKSLGVRSLPPNLQCGESVTIEGQAYTISAVTLRYQLRKGKYEQSEKRLDVLSTGRYLYILKIQMYIDIVCRCGGPLQVLTCTTNKNDRISYHKEFIYETE